MSKREKNMKKELLTIVVCPCCRKKELTLSHIFSNEFQEVIDGIIVCAHCNNWYPVIKGIPRLLPDELKYSILKTYNSCFIERYKDYIPNIGFTEKLLEKELKAKVQTSDAFGYEWTHWPEAKKGHYGQFVHWTEPYSPSFFKGKVVLDAGCGTGNHCGYMADWGATIIGIDFSEAITVTYENKNLFKPHAHFIQADIYHPPFPEEYFDFIYSHGVLHHLLDPEKGFHTLGMHLKKGGTILIRMYNKEDNFFMIYFIEKFFKGIIKHLPFFVINAISFFLASLLFFIIHTIYKPFYKINKKLGEILLPYFYYFIYISQFSFYQLHLIVFDLLIAPLAFYYKKDELLKWYAKPNFEVISILGKDEGAWRIAGRKD